MCYLAKLKEEKGGRAERGWVEKIVNLKRITLCTGGNLKDRFCRVEGFMQREMRCESEKEENEVI